MGSQPTEGLDDRALEALLLPAPPPGDWRLRPDPVALHEELQQRGVTLLLPWQECLEAHSEAPGLLEPEESELDSR